MQETKKQYLETFIGIVLGEAKTFYENKFADLKKRNMQLETQLTFLKDNPISKEEYIKEAGIIAREMIERELKIPKKIIPMKTPETVLAEKFLKSDEELKKILEESHKKPKIPGTQVKTTKKFEHDSIMITPEIEPKKQNARSLKTHKMLDKADRIIKRITKEPEEDAPETDELLDDFVRKEKPEEQEKRKKKLAEQSESLSKRLEEIETGD